MRGIETLIIYQGITAGSAFTIGSLNRLSHGGHQTLIAAAPGAQDEDVNDLFSAYMAQRKDKPFSNNNNTPNNGNKGNSEEVATVGSRKKSKSQLVQPIPLQKSNSSTLPPNPPSLLQQSQADVNVDVNVNADVDIDIQSINQSIESFSQSMQEKLNQLRNSSELLPEDVDDILDSYQQQQQQQQAQQLDYDNDLLVKEIVSRAQKDQEVMKEREDAVGKFREYEESLRRDLDPKRRVPANTNSNLAANVSTLDNSNGNSNNKEGDMNQETKGKESFEEIQLKMLEDLLDKRNEAAFKEGFDNEEIYGTDNIQEGIEELKKKVEIQKSAPPGQLQKSESMKEWQMYRAIVTKLANEGSGSGNGGGGDLDKGGDGTGSLEQVVNNSQMAQDKLEAWKEFQIKEEEMRVKSGLTIKYKLPFEWSDKPDAVENKVQKRGPIDGQKAEQARSEMDDLALEVLTNLMIKTEDPGRKLKLQNEIVGLKESIRVRLERLKNRGPVEVTQKKKVVPVTIGEVLRKSKKSVPLKKKVKEEGVPVPVQLQEETVLELDESEDDYQEMDDTVMFEDEIEDDVSLPPDSPFFREFTEKKGSAVVLTEDEDNVDEFEDEDDIDEDAPTLGTFEEQKFRSMVARSGVRTAEGQNELKEKWEDFQKAEKMMREQAGLSASGSIATNSVVPAPKIGYDVNTLFKEDGDIDFDKILTSIGTRPSRKKGKVPNSESSAPEVQASTTAVLDIPKDVITNSDVQPTQLIDTKQETVQVQASDVAVDSTVTSNQQIIEDPPKEEAEKPIQKEQRSERGSLTFGNDEQKTLSSELSGFEQRKEVMLKFNRLSVSQIDSLMALKGSPYASGVSPYVAMMNKPYKDYGAIFSLEGVLVDLTGLQYSAWTQTAKIYDFQSPILEDIKLASVHKEEFAIQRIFYWTDDTFAAKKIADTYRDLRRVIFDEWKESQVKNQDHSVSPTIENDPTTDDATNEETSDDISDDSTDLENDINDIQFTAWERAAKSYGYQPPTRDLLNIVETLKPDDAVRSVFRWTNDFVVSSDVGTTYRKYLKEETSKWLSEKGRDVPIASSPSQLNADTPLEPTKRASGPSVEDILIIKQNAWQAAIKNAGCHFNSPSLDELQVVEFAGLDRAISSVFKWNVSSDIAESMLHEYREVLKALTTEFLASLEEPELRSPEESSSDEDPPEVDLPIFVLKDGVENWLNALENIDVPRAVVSHMEQDIVDEILEAAKLSAFFPPDNRVSSAAGYSSIMQEMLGGALRLERRPDHCVVFSATPQSAVACHEAEMKNVAIVSPYPYYELTTSDMTVRDFDSIGIRNLKSVFSEIPEEEPMEQIESEAPKRRRQTLLKTRFWDDEDE
eukprot:scaffold2292_cov259-Chaetoceros_neogracile.AAC.3